MMRGLILATLMVGLPVGVQAAPAAPKPAAAPAAAKGPVPVAPPAAPGSRRVTLSPEGRAIASKVMGNPDPRATQIQTELKAIGQQKLQVVSASSIDVDKLVPLFRKEETLQAELRTRMNDRLLSLMRALPPADRAALVQSLINPARPQGAAPVPGAPAIAPGN